MARSPIDEDIGSGSEGIDRLTVGPRDPRGYCSFHRIAGVARRPYGVDLPARRVAGHCPGDETAAAVHLVDLALRPRPGSDWRQWMIIGAALSQFTGSSIHRTSRTQLCSLRPLLSGGGQDHLRSTVGSRRVRASGNAAAERAAITQNPCAPKRSKIGPLARVSRAVATPMPTVP